GEGIACLAATQVADQLLIPKNIGKGEACGLRIAGKEANNRQRLVVALDICQHDSRARLQIQWRELKGIGQHDIVSCRIRRRKIASTADLDAAWQGIWLPTVQVEALCPAQIGQDTLCTKLCISLELFVGIVRQNRLDVGTVDANGRRLIREGVIDELTRLHT